MDKDTGQIGEGDYEAARAYRERSRRFLAEQGQDIEKLARDAEAALAGEDAEALKAAEDEGRSHARG